MLQERHHASAASQTAASASHELSWRDTMVRPMLFTELLHPALAQLLPVQGGCLSRPQASDGYAADTQDAAYQSAAPAEQDGAGQPCRSAAHDLKPFTGERRPCSLSCAENVAHRASQCRRANL